jgi:putative transcriptional regulator
MVPEESDQSFLSGQLLVAMPQMADPRFARTVVYLCAHSSDGAMGLVVNRLIDSLTFSSLLSQLGVEAAGAPADMPVHFGGPVESSRGFVQHTSD